MVILSENADYRLDSIERLTISRAGFNSIDSVASLLSLLIIDTACTKVTSMVALLSAKRSDFIKYSQKLIEQSEIEAFIAACPVNGHKTGGKKSRCIRSIFPKLSTSTSSCSAVGICF